jgi:SAM-dependent methyltransferase
MNVPTILNTMKWKLPFAWTRHHREEPQLLTKPDGPLAILFPPEFDAAFYRERHHDLAKFSDADLFDHYQRHGREEGRISSRAVPRDAFLKYVPAAMKALEIGPGLQPCLEGPNVKYFEVVDTAALVARAAQLNEDASRIPRIDYLSPSLDLAIVDEQFEVVLSSHCIEHQPDLIRHIQAVDRLLVDGGCYVLVIPDRRYCFDHYLRDSTLADVLDAYYAERKVHLLKSVIEHRALTTHNDSKRHWKGDHAMEKDVQHVAAQAVEEWKAADGGYVDVHAWQFTPASFRDIIDALAGLGYIAMKPARVYPTLYGWNEFYAVLEKQQ